MRQLTYFCAGVLNESSEATREFNVALAIQSALISIEELVEIELLNGVSFEDRDREGLWLRS